MQIGDTYEVTGAVAEENTARSLGSGAMHVFGTPWMIAMMENAAFLLMQQGLPEGRSSVGTYLEIAHVSPSPVGMPVRAAAEFVALSANGKIAEFKVSAYDEAGLIGEGTHRRAYIDVARFMEKCEGKLKKED
ncbi:MAG: thioesterase family protein [Oscillospiraceae bacterium]|nr:thioesterase family protein [Oscillospiraceae bacterium]